MSHRLILLLLFLIAALPKSHAQATPTASRIADLQLGVSVSGAIPDYGTNVWHGYGFYGDLDVAHHLGLEIDFHQLSGPYPVLYERTYEIGPRFVFAVRQRFAPYGKALYGRGVFNFPGTNASGQSVEVANLAYNTYTLGGGLDFKLRPGINLRLIDYEYQRWPSFPAHGLNPNVFSFGVAYHFHGGMTK
ncbi:outer membrane protein [Granulicella sibirica]|uniref:Outer membrane protein beta-barrel domain-containing protein n=1 Tax=Granulicella sibirica TaxID=2479048 RepID=A0A4Q0T1X3_9BACT|nr:outer membrane beta-barrel protein [Granulicella sibirica]RXH55909.1 hypothetical protein GRAN_2766 [Granulicella sibirica]